MPRLSISLLGAIQITLDGETVVGFNSNKVRALLAYLVTEAERPHHRDKLAALFWPETSGREARNNLRYALSNLRGAIQDRNIAPPFLLVSRESVQFNPQSDHWLDVNSFLHSLSPQYSDHDSALTTEQAVQLYKGDFLEGFSIDGSAAFDEWTTLNREHLNHKFADTLHQLTDYYERKEDFSNALRHARHLAALTPWSEETHRQIMRLLASSGQRSAALVQYESLIAILKDDLGTAPDEETTTLYERLRAGELPSESPGFSQQRVRGYEIHEVLGAGLSGVVYRAKQPVIDRDVAIKVIHARYSNQPDFIRRFENEARLVARLEHPHIVPLYDYWREPDGAYLVMRWIRGGNLAATLNRGPWNLKPAVRMIEQISTALTMAHQQGIVHRDIKPANILIDQESNAYISDFGISRIIWENPANKAQQDPDDSSSSGSLGYISPEAMRGETVSPLMDIYSLGIMLYEVLAGQHPFPGLTGQKLIEKHLSAQLPSIQKLRPELPAAIDEIIQQATAKDPSRRFLNAIAMASALQQLVQEPGISTPKTRMTAPALELQNPYKGLRSFQEADAADFFGREAFVEELLSYLSPQAAHPTAPEGWPEPGDDNGRFLSLVGPSGSGKSSVIKAGVLPALRRGALPGSSEWYIVEMSPGSHPLEELKNNLLRIATDKTIDLQRLLHLENNGLLQAARSILPSDRDILLLVIDQFEELFSAGVNEIDREHFIQNICTAVLDPESQIRVILTLRADFYDRPLKHPDFGSLVADHTIALLPLTTEELTRAVEGPAKRIGVQFEQSLVNTIVDDVNQRPGALPMLQYALTELFEYRKQNLLTNHAYQTIGGVSGALARRAEEVYARLNETGKHAAQQLFLRLVTLGEGTEDTRRRILHTELDDLEDEASNPQIINELLDQCGRARLLTFDHDPATRQRTVEIAHEALLREWRRLQEWLDGNRDDIRTQRKLSAAAGEWIHADRDPSFLVSGSRLDRFDDWSRITNLALTGTEQDFLNACISERQAHLDEEADQEEREAALEKRSRLFLRALAGILTAATIIAAGLTLLALNQKRQALEAYSLSLAANAQQALNDRDSSTALVLSIAANNIENSPIESQRILMNAAYAPGPRKQYNVESIFTAVEAPITALAVSTHGSTTLLGFTDGTIILWNRETGEEIQRLFGHTAEVNEIVLSPDGKHALSAGNDSRVIYWDLNQGTAVHLLYGHSGVVRAVDIHPNGRLAVSGGFSGASYENPGELILWDLKTGQETSRFDGHISGVVEAIFAQSGDTILSASGDTELFTDLGTERAEIGADLFDMILWDTSSGKILNQFENLDYDASDIAITPDGERAIIASYYDNISSLWDLESGEQIFILDGHHDSIRTVAISADDQHALTASDDGSLILWDMQTAEMEMRFKAHTDGILDVAFSPDGRSALSSGRDGILILWDLHNAAEINRFSGHQDMVWDVAFTPDGLGFLSGSGAASPAALSQDTSIRLWNLDTGEEIKSFDLPAQVIFQVDISPDGKTALITTNEPFVRVWDLEKWTEIGLMEGHEAWAPGLDISPDGKHVLTCSVDGTLISWDLNSQEALYRLDGHGKGLWAVSISPDGRTALSDSGDSSMILWDLEKGKEIQSYTPTGGLDEVGSSGIAFLPDGETAISGSNGGEIIHWDLASGNEIRRFGKHNDIRSRIEISPDGLTALTSGMDGTFKLWDIETGELIHEFSSQQQVTVFDIAMSPDGLTALSGSSDHSIIHWQLMNPSLDELKEWINTHRYVRPLTCAERKQFRIEPLCEE